MGESPEKFLIPISTTPRRTRHSAFKALPVTELVEFYREEHNGETLPQVRMTRPKLAQAIAANSEAMKILFPEKKSVSAETRFARHTDSEIVTMCESFDTLNEIKQLNPALHAEIYSAHRNSGEKKLLSLVKKKLGNGIFKRGPR